MDIQSSKLIDQYGENLKIKRALYLVMTAALAISIVACYGLDNNFILRSGAIRSLVDALSKIFPAIRAVAVGAREPIVASFVLASQWIFFPAYLILLIWIRPPWGSDAGEKMARKIIKRRNEKKEREFFAVLCFGTVSVILILLSDLQLIHFFPSLVTGSLFSDPVISQSWLFSSYHNHTVGLIFISWFSPLGEAAICVAFLVCIRALCLTFKKNLVSQYGSNI